jgi:ABC-type transport system substrate-binding protein
MTRTPFAAFAALAIALAFALAAPSFAKATEGSVLRSSTGAKEDARGEGIPHDTWPASWFGPPKTASELGITRFRESPVLGRPVARGELPPVRERLPEDPIVVEPLERIGRHGGTAVVFSTSNRSWGEGDILNNIEPPLRICPEVRSPRPNYAKRWEYSQGGRTLTLYLRKGIRWSDGHPHTSADYVFWFEHMQKNKDLTPIRSAPWDTAEVTAPDEHTVRFVFEKPNPFFVKELAHHGDAYRRPGHYLKRYHADFVPKDELERRALSLGFDDWVGYFWKMQSTTDPAVDCPTTRAYVQPDLTFEDRGLREIFRDVRFRKALSLATNRDEINETVYFGRGTPRQTTVIPSSRIYEEESAKAYTAV